jgi:hypothetical protein
MSVYKVIRCALLFTLLFGVSARADKATQRAVDVKAKRACGCVTPCTDQGMDSWCFTGWSCDVSSTGMRGAYRYCDPAAEQARFQGDLLVEGCDTAKWKDFRDSLINDYSVAPDRVLKAIDTCRHHISYTAAKKPVKDHYETCVGRVEKLYKILERPGLGLSKNTDAYHAAYTAKLAIPAELANETLFDDLQKANLSDAASVKKVVDKIKDLSKGSIVVAYVSPGTRSIDKPETYGRIVAWVNSGGLSRYVQFSVNAKAGDTTADRYQASVVNVEGKNKAYIFDWTRSATDRHVFEYKSDKAQNNQRCYQCHTSGVLAIHPFDAVHEEADREIARELGEGYADWLGPLNATYAAELVKLNAQIRKDFSPQLVVVDAPNRTLDGAFTGAAMMPDPMDLPGEAACGKGGVAAVTASFVGSANKDCVTCHDKRGSPVISEASLQTMMNRYIGLGFMPPGNTASTENRQKAARCFVDGYSLGAPNSALTAWLKAPACE